MNTKRIASTVIMLMVVITSFAIGKDSINAITMESYEQSWLDSRGTIALKNNTNETIHNVTFQITYLNMSGKPLDYETYTKNVDINPGMTKQIDIPGYQSNRRYSYYKSEADLSTPHKFKIKYKLKNYNQEEANEKGSSSLSDNGSSEDNSIFYIVLSIVAVIFVFGFYIGLYVLVAFMAKSRNRSQVLWLIVALFTTPILAIIILLCIGKSYDESMRIE